MPRANLDRSDRLTTPLPTAWVDHAGSFAVRWFRRVLTERLDPVVALHRTEPRDSSLDPQWNTHLVHTAYETSRVDELAGEGREPTDALQLDRQGPKALVATHVGDLLESPDRRVEALVAHAAPRNLLHEFPRQAITYLQNRGVARAKLESIRFPRAQGRPEELLLDAVRADLGARESETLPHLLTRHAPRTRPALLWLDFGTFQDRPPLPLDAWLQFCCDVLAEKCPEDLRIVAYLGIEHPPERHQELRDAMEGHAESDDFFSKKFRCSGLEPLPPVRKMDLKNFLNESRNCPPEHAREAVDLLHRVCRGDYEETVGWIRRAWTEGWPRILRELRGKK